MLPGQHQAEELELGLVLVECELLEQVQETEIGIWIRSYILALSSAMKLAMVLDHLR
jgi:hypothetical protein